MIPRYRNLKLTEDQLKRSIRFQYLAVHDPKKIVFTKDFVPRDALDKRVMELLKKSDTRFSSTHIGFSYAPTLLKKKGPDEDRSKKS